jgi:hypothetical protein
MRNFHILVGTKFWLLASETEEARAEEERSEQGGHVVTMHYHSRSKRVSPRLYSPPVILVLYHHLLT